MKAEEETRKLRAAAEAQTQRMKEIEQRTARERSARQGRGRSPVGTGARKEAEARAEAEAAARERASVEERINAERQAKYEAEARAKIEAEEARQAPARLCPPRSTPSARRRKKPRCARASKRARARRIEEDTRAKVQAEIEGDMTKRAEIEGKAQAKAYMQAKEKAEQDEDDRLRAEQARKAREIADVLRTKVEPDEEAPELTPSSRRIRKQKSHLVRNIFFSLLGSVIVAVIAAARDPDAQPRGQGRAGDDRLAARRRVDRLDHVPPRSRRPHLKVENLNVGKLLDAKAATGAHLPRHRLALRRQAQHQLGRAGRRDAQQRGDASGFRSGARSRAARIAAPISTDQAEEREDGREAGAGAVQRHAAVRRAKARCAARSSRASSGWTLGMRPAEKGGMDLDFSARNWALPHRARVPGERHPAQGHWHGPGDRGARVRGLDHGGQGATARCGSTGPRA